MFTFCSVYNNLSVYIYNNLSSTCNIESIIVTGGGGGWMSFLEAYNQEGDGHDLILKHM